MADISGITGYSIHAPFSDFGGNAGPSSTTTGVGGVGAYHRRHRNQVGDLQDSADSSSPPNPQDDLLLPIDSSAVPARESPSWSTIDDQSPFLAGGYQTALAAWLAANDSKSNSSGASGQLLNTLV